MSKTSRIVPKHGGQSAWCSLTASTRKVVEELLVMVDEPEDLVPSQSAPAG